MATAEGEAPRRAQTAAAAAARGESLQRPARAAGSVAVAHAMLAEPAAAVEAEVVRMLPAGSRGWAARAAARRLPWARLATSW
jgi:hypothetical protein